MRPRVQLRIWPFLFVVVSSLLSSGFAIPEARENGSRRNDEVVARLLNELREGGQQTPPDPPKSLGVHTGCIKHGLACPDSYVDFLRKLRKGGKTSGRGTELNTSEQKARSPGAHNSPPNARKGAPRSNRDVVDEVELENIRRLHNVMTERLEEQKSPGKQWHCEEVRWFYRGLYFALTVHDILVDRYWNFVLYRFLPCALLTAILTWIFFGDRMPYEHLVSLLADNPASALSAEMARRKPPTSVAELVIQRESYNNTNYADLDGGNDLEESKEAREFLPPANFTELVRLQKEARKSEIDHRNDRWSVARFALLEAHAETSLTVTVLKLRLVLSVLVFLTLVWTLLALPLRVADLRSGDGGIVHHLFAAMCPSWMTTSLLLYLGWSWMGGMVAFAGWEVVSAGEAIVKSDARAAALHEKILQRWCS